MVTYDPRSKKIGSYLIDAGLLDVSQVQVALNDQRATGHRFGDIVVKRGWVKKQTLEYVIGKVVNFERTLGRPLDKKLFENMFRERKRRDTGSI